MQDLTFWLVAYTGSGTYLGKTTNIVNTPMPGNTVQLSPAVGLIDQHVPVMDPQTRQPGMQHQVLTVPVGLMLDWENSKISVLPTAIVRICELGEEDQRHYAEIIAKSEHMLAERRARRAGLTTTQPSLIQQGQA